MGSTVLTRYSFLPLAPEVPAASAAFARLVSAITHGSRIPIDLARFSLTPLERKVLDILRRGNAQIIEPGTGEPAGERVLALYGEHRVGIREWKAAASPAYPDEPPRLLVELDPATWEHYLRARDYLAVEHQARLREVRAFLDAVHERGRLSQMLASLQRVVLHMPPVVHFVGDRIYSSLPQLGANITDSRQTKGLLSLLASTPPQGWCVEDQQFVFALHVLVASGDYYWLEEMNWMQVDAITLDEYLDMKIAAFTHLLFNPRAGEVDATLQQKARRLRSLQTELASKYSLCRSIHGPTLNKRLTCLGRTRIEPGALVPPLAEELADAFGEDPTSAPDAATYLRRVARRAIDTDRVKSLILTVVNSGLRETRSDFFMSRGPREIACTDRYRELEIGDFYCVVLARPGFDPAALGLRNSVNEMRWNQARRMQFNGWKFWYGNLEDHERSETQYWFVPPTLPDVAAGENFVHSGHRENAVAQSIRFPAALTLTHIATKRRRLFLSACDVRGVRSSSEPSYGEEEMAAAIQHGLWMSVILQFLADYGAQVGTPARIDGFHKEFYFSETGARRIGAGSFEPLMSEAGARSAHPNE